MRILILFLVFIQLVNAKELPKENVIEFPAESDGLCLHSLFQSNMVLQRGKPITIRGLATSGESVSVTFSGIEKTANAAVDRRWSVEFPAQEANANPQIIVVKGKDKTITLENILIGDVWVLGGQSNMEHPVSRVEEGELEILSSNRKLIRLLTIPAQNGAELKSGFPRLMEWSAWFSSHFRKGYWDECAPEHVREFSAIGYVFAKRLQESTQIPIGVIDASRGGTTLESWTPLAVFKSIETSEVKLILAEWEKKVAEFNPEEDLKKRQENYAKKKSKAENEGKKFDEIEPKELLAGPIADPNYPGNNFANMISPLAGFPVKGTIWHQGFNNAFDGSVGAEMYYQVFAPMIKAWRANFNDPEMAFGIISLCTAGDPQTLDNYSEQMYDIGVYLRNYQFKTFLDLYNSGDKNIGYASSFDKRRSWYHPGLKFPVGERIARWALATQYGKKVVWKAPVITGVETVEGKLQLKVDTKLRVDDSGPIRGFSISGADGKFYPAEAEFFKNGKDKDTSVIILSSIMVPKPVHYRYAWARNPMGNLYVSSMDDIPLATQRSDSWQLRDIGELILKDEKIARDLDKKQGNALKNAFREMDLIRRLKEAQKLIEENKVLFEKVK